MLVYIHNDKSMFSHIFCKTIFSHTIIIDYLLDNYIVWPWDITHESNRDESVVYSVCNWTQNYFHFRLTKIWKDLFDTDFFNEFSIDDCPLIIGIIRDELAITEYQCKPLLRGNILTHTQMSVDELHVFKNLCNKNELVIVSIFVIFVIYERIFILVI